MAEGLFSHLSPEDETFSAGTNVTSENENKLISEIDSKVVKTMEDEGVDVTKKVRNQLTPELVEKADKVVALNSIVELPEYLKNSPKLEVWDVSNAVGQEQEFYNNLRDLIKTKVLDLIKRLRNSSSNIIH